jgi:23S rRNA (cytidine1920-2'-O)/16S rRNA (cytidine1409-2'-O)-methyltransferase
MTPNVLSGGYQQDIAFVKYNFAAQRVFSAARAGRLQFWDDRPYSRHIRYKSSMPFASRAGQKLDHALNVFGVDVAGLTCADLGSNVGGFVDCLLQRGAAKVYAVEKGYGVLEYRLRKDARVVVMERTNAMHVTLAEAVSLVTIDVAWTRQRNILPAARKILKPEGRVITLIKPHYEAAAGLLKKGILPEAEVDGVVRIVEEEIAKAGFIVQERTRSPIVGSGGNVEVLAILRPTFDQTTAQHGPSALV